MSVVGDDTEIDERVSELVERGLERYGGGDLEGAVAEWQHALTLDPENQRAADYLAYVEKHYELSGVAPSGDRVAAATVELEFPFGIEDLGLARGDDDLEDYESFEIIGEPVVEVDSKFDPSDSVDDGWSFDNSWSGKPPSAPVTDREIGSHESSPFDAENEPVQRITEDEEEPTRDRSALKEALASFGDLEADEATRRTFAAAHDDDDMEREPTTSHARLELEELTSPGGADEEDALSQALSSDALSLLQGAATHDVELENTAERAGAVSSSSFDSLELDGLDQASHKDDRSRGEQDGDARISFRGALEGTDGGLGSLSLDPPTEDTFDRRLESRNEQEEELTVDRRLSTWSPPPRERSRPPTEDPGLTARSIELDDAHLSFEDATREHGIRDLQRPRALDPEPVTAEISLRGSTEREVEPTADPGAELFDEVCRQAPAGQGEERIRFIVQRLLDRAVRDFSDGKLEDAASVSATAIECHAESAVSQKLVQENRDVLVRIFTRAVGDLSLSPRLAVPLQEIPVRDIDNRAAFLLSRIDGTLSLDDILDVSAMPRLEALRHLFRLRSRGFIEVR